MKKLVSSVLATAALLALPLAANAVTFQFNAALSGASEVPPNGAPGTGVATLFYNDKGTASTADDTFNFSLSAFGLSGLATGAHIHAPGAVGVNAPVLVPLDVAPFAFFNPGGGTVLIGGSNVAAPTTSFLGQLQAGLAYVNLHTAQFPGGEIRGQLIQVAVTPVPEPATFAMLGAGLLVISVFSRRRAASTP
jgi:hypothetical protein